MKRYSLLILIVYNLVSCSKDKRSTSENFPKSYVLTKMTERFEGSETTGKDMEWQESYCLFKNKTFSKSRNWNGTNIMAEGTYSFIIIDNANFIEFTYNVESTIIANCYGNLKEIMSVISDLKINGTWSYCDGPGLEYERSEVCGMN